MPLPQSLRRNQGRYLGETIDITDLLERIRATANRRNWTAAPILSQPVPGIYVFHRAGSSARRRFYISAGIHGDEPAGPLAVEALLLEDLWPDTAEFWLVPCLNPSGFRLNSRTNAAGRDLNRDYLRPTSAEVRAHTRLLDQLPRFDATICLHEDWEAQGFYLYELNGTPADSIAGSIIKAVSPICPIDPSTSIDGRPASRGVIRPDLDLTTRTEWPEALYLFQHKTSLSFTLEAPSDFEPGVRVRALVAAVQTILKALAPV